ncbi:4-hydroxy-tetrahydrodipicolinate synthase [Bacteroidota bacterium]
MSTRTMFSGTGVAMITPFSDDGSVNYKDLEKHADRLIQNGIDYLVVLGTTAEPPTLSKEEKIEIIRVIKSTNSGRVPMVVGAGGNSTEEVIGWIKTIGSEGIDAYLSVAPYYNKPSQLGMKQHFSAIASCADVPIMLYNVPGRTSSNISADTVLELANELEENILAVKEASGDFSQIMKILKDRPEGFSVVSGDDAITLPMIAAGADGVVSVIGNALPVQFSAMVRKALEGDFENARAIHYKIMPFIDLIFREGSPTGVKALMEELGFGKSNLRLPLIPASESLTKEISLALQYL